MIKVGGKQGAVELSRKMLKGDDGGYYIPNVEDGVLTFKPSEEDMIAIEEAFDIKGEQGIKGEPGVYVGETEPTDTDALVWINPAGDASNTLATKEYVDEKIDGLEIDVDLYNYYNKSEVDAKIETIELTPGEPGYTPVKGVDYFDGEPGYTPVKGVDYFDGEPGYTPIKGVDYFDGKNGEDYILTDNDKSDIANLVLDMLPAAEGVEV